MKETKWYHFTLQKHQLPTALSYKTYNTKYCHVKQQMTTKSHTGCRRTEKSLFLCSALSIFASCEENKMSRLNIWVSEIIT